MTTWLSNSATSNKLKQTYVKGFIDVSGDIIIRNNNELNFYDNNTSTKNFSINSEEISVYDGISAYNDISNVKLVYIKDLSENVQTKLTEFSSKLKDISNNFDSNYAINIIQDSQLVRVNDAFETNSDVSLNNGVFINGTTTLSGDIIPSVSATYNLGSEDKPFGSLYISNNTIFFQGENDENSGTMKFDDGDISILKKGEPEANRRKLTASSSTGNKLAIGKNSRDADAELDVSGNTILRGNVIIKNNLDVCGNFYAQYPESSIPVNAINGNIGLTVSTIKGNNPSKVINDINFIRFDTDSGFDIDDLSNGAVKVKMNSTFKTWKVDGQQDLVAEGLDSMTLVAGDNMNLTTYQDPKSLKFDVDLSSVDISLNLKSDKTYIDASLNLKLPVSNPIVNGLLIVNNGDVSLNQDLNVGGNTVLDGDLSIHGNLSVFQTENNTVINTTVNNYDLVVSEDLSLNGELSVKDNASFNNNIFISNDLSVGNHASFNSNIVVLGDSSFNGRVDICGNFYAQYPPNSIPASAIIGGVGGGSNFQIGNDDIIYDDGEFALIKDTNTDPPSEIFVSGTLTVSGDVSFNNGTVLIPTPSSVDNTNSAVTIGYIEELGLITASGLLRQFSP
jgi:hypothetical protein